MHRRISRWVSSGKLLITDGCWLWSGCTNSDGYGKVNWQGDANAKLHRVMYSIYNPQVDITGRVIRHSCDNPLCANPEHLSVGLQSDNVADRVSRQRSYNHVDPYELRIIGYLRLKGLTYKEIAQRLSIGVKRVEYVIKRKLRM